VADVQKLGEEFEHEGHFFGPRDIASLLPIA
jgi:hypothetical protein